MPPEELDRLMDDLRAWCCEKYGRQAEVASELGVSKQLVTNWLAGRRVPSLKLFFKIRRFLDEHQKQPG
jgi:transcriptional regulator with XRE-family HTH domain